MDSEEFAHSLGYEFAYVGLANPHHQFIGDLMQTGIVGVLLSLAMTIYLFVISIKRHNYPLLVFMVIFFMIMQIEMPLYLPKGTMFFWLLSFCCVLNQQAILDRALSSFQYSLIRKPAAYSFSFSARVLSFLNVQDHS